MTNNKYRREPSMPQRLSSKQEFKSFEYRRRGALLGICAGLSSTSFLLCRFHELALTVTEQILRFPLVVSFSLLLSQILLLLL